MSKSFTALPLGSGKLNLKRDLKFYADEAIDFAFGVAFSNSAVFSSCAPFGLAYYAARYENGSWIAKFLGVFLGMLLNGGATGFIKYIFPLMIYTFASAFIKIEKTYIKAGVMAMLLFLSGMAQSLVSGLLLFDIATGAVEALLCFGGVYIIKSGLSLIRGSAKRSIVSSEEILCATAVYAILILSLSKIPSFYTVSLSNVLSITLILVMCQKGEIGIGAAIGVVVGIVNGIKNYNMAAIVGTYAFAALCSGFFKMQGRVGVSLGFILSASLSSIFLNPASEMLLNVYDILAATVLFFVLPEKAVSFLTSFGQKRLCGADLLQKNEEAQNIIRKRMSKAANSIDELSKMFLQIKNFKYKKSDIINMFNCASEKVCASCPTKYVCWQSDYKETYRQMLDMLKISEEKGKISPDNMPVSFKNKCTNQAEFALAFNNMTEGFKNDRIWRAKLYESRKNAANQLKNISGVIKSISDDVCEGTDIEMEDVIKNELDKLGIKSSYVWVILKKDNKFEVMISVKNYSEDNDESIKEAVANAVGQRVRIGKAIKTNGEAVIKILPEEKFSIDVSVSSRCKDGEEKSGDSYLSVCLDGGGHVMAISDGMGSGDDAHSESVSAIKLLEGFFEAGFEAETSLNLINSALLLKSENDMFSTMDLCSVDLCAGSAKFIKICGAQSYIKTGNSVEKIMFSSIPMGILEKVDLTQCVRKIKKDSMIIMMSDGVADSGEENWEMETLKEINSKNPKVISDILIKKALENTDGEKKDDMTVIAARVWSEAV